MKAWLQDNERKSVVVERICWNLKEQNFMTSISKNVYIDKLDDVVMNIK